MPSKAQRPSASSATRKKHAKKAATSSGEVQEVVKEKKLKGKEKAKKKGEPKKKIYIPPVKPRPIQPDPLETLGIAYTIPSELLVILRLLGKKDAVTKTRALEELQSEWVSKLMDDDSQLVETIITILPVWFHHVPMLFFHPSRRIRLLSAVLHASLLRSPAVHDQLLAFLQDSASDDQAEVIIGTWCMLVHDVDPQVSSSIRRTWDDSVFVEPSDTRKILLDDRIKPLLLSFIQRTVLDPSGVYSDINPVQPAIDSIPSKKGAGKRQPPPVQVKDDFPTSPRPNIEEEFETELERKARLRIGAMGALRWMLNTRAKISGSLINDMKMLFSNPFLWSALFHGERPPFLDAEGIGYQQPGVRKAAWSLLLVILQNWQGQMETLMDVLSVGILRSAWVEPDIGVRSAMWHPLLCFLKENPKSWEVESQFNLEEGEDSDSEDEHEHDPPSAVINSKNTSLGVKPSKAYHEFLTFLELGCLGSARQGYPSVIVVLSTIPSSVMSSSSYSTASSLDEFFVSFWAAIDARALSSLDRIPASTAFLSSLLECTAFLSRRIRNSPVDVAQSVIFAKGAPLVDVTTRLSQVFKEQYSRICEEIASRHLKVDYDKAGKLISDNLTSLEQIDQVLYRSAWESFDNSMDNFSKTGNAEALEPLILVLKAMHDHVVGFKQEAPTVLLIRKTSLNVFAQCKKTVASEDKLSDSESSISSTIKLMALFGSVLFADSAVATVLYSLVADNVSRLVLTVPSLLIAYLGRAENSEKEATSLWANMLTALASLSVQDALPTLEKLIAAASARAIPTFLTPSQDMERFTVQLLRDSLTDGGKVFAVCRSLLEVPTSFISNECLEALFQTLVSTFTGYFEDALHDYSTTVLNIIGRPLDLISSIKATRPDLTTSWQISITLIPQVFLLGHLVRSNSAVTPSADLALKLWVEWCANSSEDLKLEVVARIKERLRDIVADVNAVSSPVEVLLLSHQADMGIEFEVMDILPSHDLLEKSLDTLPVDPFDSSLAILDPLVPPDIESEESLSSDVSFDRSGYSCYARLVGTILAAFSEDRTIAKKHPWALQHLIALSSYAEQFLQLPFARNTIFDHKSVSTKELRKIKSRVHEVTTYVLSTGLDIDDRRWHEKVIASGLSDAAIELEGAIDKFLVEMMRKARRTDNYRDSVILHVVLQHILSGVGKEEADQWMFFARRLEKSAPQASMAVTLSVTRFAPEPPRLERYRNELAADALGFKRSQINSAGLLLLRKLAMTAPDPDSDVVFLPQTRAVQLIKACQQWAGSDEDIDEAVQSEFTLLFYHLAPILQHVSGSHWDFIFDVVENNFENCSLDDKSTLVTLARSLKLVLVIQDLAKTNRILRAAWQERQVAVLTLIRDLAAKPLSSPYSSSPLSICRELVLTVVQDLPASLIEKETLSNMCHLLNDSSAEVQKMAYQLLHASAKRRTEYLIIEAGVTSDTPVKLELPLELVDFLQRNIDFDDDATSRGQAGFGYMLGWMVLFDLFIDSSLKVRLGYTNHLRNLGMIETHFLPNILSVLDLYDGVVNAVKLEIWGVDEYFVQLYDPENLTSLQLFAAHLYYRALSIVPALVRSWLLDCKDRQLSTAVTTYTSKHFSSVLVHEQMARVKGPEGAALDDEHMTIKISSVLNEITASYSIDDNQFEITLKVPSDWPLHSIEAKDVKKAAIKEDRWRSWILGVQQIMWSQSGNIIDGLSMFKRNIAGYFAGQVECAICYSIISATNGNLPDLPCNTCNNRFHASCLYQWFNSSHSSSCPLCRSQIIV